MAQPTPLLSYISTGKGSVPPQRTAMARGRVVHWGKSCFGYLVCEVLCAYYSSVREGLATGLCLGSLICVLLGSYALVILFGSKMIVQRGYTEGTVINVIIVVLTGSM